MDKNEIEIALKLLNEAENNKTLQPSFIKIGHSLENIINAVIQNPTESLNEVSNIFKENLRIYLQKFKKVDPKNAVLPANEISYPILTRLNYVECTELRQMFTNLLVSASNKENINKAHPAFIRIIDSLAIDEARIIQYMYKTKRPYLIFASYNNKETAESGILYKNGRAITCVEIYGDLLFPNMVDFYLDNLIQLGLLHSSVNLDITTKDINYSNHDIPILREKLQQKKVNHNGLTDIIEGGFGRTEFCELFMEACLSNDEE